MNKQVKWELSLEMNKKVPLRSCVVTREKLEKKASKAETLTTRDDEVIITEEQAKPNPVKSKINEKALNPQPFPPADQVQKKLQNVKTKTN